MQEKIDEYIAKTKDFGAEEIIRFAYSEFQGKIKLATSLGEEDQVLTDLIARIQPEISVFTLDTGRLFQQTYDLLAKTQQRYPLNFEVYYPDTAAVEDMVRSKGINLFYESIDNRKLCCGVRKVEPLGRALKDVDAWITGLRRAQSITRAQIQTFEWDAANKKVKVNPLAAWSREQVQKYIEENDIDINTLHAEGFVSIGCAPCTRAIQPGDDIRQGRWWWEDPEQKECGLHNNPNRPREQE